MTPGAAVTLTSKPGRSEARVSWHELLEQPGFAATRIRGWAETELAAVTVLVLALADFADSAVESLAVAVVGFSLAPVVWLPI